MLNNIGIPGLMLLTGPIQGITTPVAAMASAIFPPSWLAVIPTLLN